jgi:catechol 2,3-dioxygenase-like lactoylglutathione lyase family enzyme
MFNHIVVGSNDLERSRLFYDAVLRVLGYQGPPLRNVTPSGHARLFYRHDGGTLAVSEPIDGDSATVGNGSTLAFRCSTPELVQAFHDAAVRHGGTSIEDPPGLRESALGRLWLAYVRDPDGNKLCAIHRIPATTPA